MEILLPADDDYVIQVKALSDGGEGISTETISVHKLSKSYPLQSSPPSPDPLGYLSRFSVTPVYVISYNSIYFNPVDYWIIGMDYFALAKR